MRTTIANQKGGVAKTETTRWLLINLAAMGYRVLGVDFDPQSSLSKRMLECYDETAPTVADLMDPEPRVAWNQVALPIAERLHILPANKRLEAAKREMTINPLGVLSLSKVLNAIEGTRQYDIILIDTPPDLGALTLAAIVASTHILVAAQPEADSLAGVERVKESVTNLTDLLQTFGWQPPKLLGIVATMVEPGIKQHEQNLARMRHLPGLPLLGTIPKRKGERRDAELRAAYQPVAEAIAKEHAHYGN